MEIEAIGPVQTAGTSHPPLPYVAKAFVEWANSHGGIHGHPVDVKFCDDHGSANDAVACARTAVATHVVAVYGDSFSGSSYMPILNAAHIPYFSCCGLSNAEYTASDSFLIGNQPVWAAALIVRAVQDGCKKMSAVIIDGAQTFEPLMNNALKAKGASLHNTVILPGTSQDYSAQVAKSVAGGTDCEILVVPETQLTQYLVNFAQSGSHARLYGPQGNLDSVSIKGIPSNITNGAEIAGSFPDLSTAPFAGFRAALAATKADMSHDYNSNAGMGGWAAYTIMFNVLNKMTQPITAANFLTALNRTSDVPTDGMTGRLDFTKPWTAYPQYSRLFNRSAIYSTIKDGKIVPQTTTFADLSNLSLGHQ